MEEKTSVPALDEILGKQFKILDKGFIRVIDYMGDDSSIVQAARVSYGKGTKSVSEDEGLINFLIRHKHTSPLEMCEIKLHVKLPIFVARQWLRHRTASLNEMSARYSIINEEYFLPDEADLRYQSKRHKQGGDGTIDTETASGIREKIKEMSEKCFAEYDDFIEKNDLTRELSRIILPQNTYTEMYWKIDLHNLFHMLHLRTAPGAQKEIRDYANCILHEIVKLWVPICYKAFINYRTDACHFSGLQMEQLKGLLDKEKVTEFIEMNSKKRGEMRELKELLEKLLGEELKVKSQEDSDKDKINS
jgi:thymidylate synthase (FAD)